MHPVVNHLIQLQDLMLIRNEQRVHGKTDHLEGLDASIRGMTARLPKDAKTLYEKLRKRDHIILAPASTGICAACGMQLPISLVQLVRQAREMQSCPNCARVLYMPDASARVIGRRPRRDRGVKMGIARFSAESLMVPRLQATDAEGAIEELASKMEESGFVDKAERLVDTALRREAIVSTAAGHGLAFPHARGVEGGGLTMALGISQKGIPFDPVATSTAKIIFFITIPLAASAFYLKLLSGLAETFSEASARKAVMAEKDPAKLWKALCRVTRTTVK